MAEPLNLGWVRAVAGAAAVALAACGTPAPSPASTGLATGAPIQTMLPPAVAAGMLTGPPPLIVQVENSPAARPQSGLSEATLVYEYVAEGGVGRFSAIYALPPTGRVGPVRSARLVTVALLKLYAGVLAYSGGSSYMEGVLARSGHPHYNEDSAGSDLFRIDSRAPPHNLYSDGTHLADLLGRSRAAPIAYPYLSPTGASSPGKTATSFTVPISIQEIPKWTWDATERGWTRAEPDTGTFADAGTGQPVVATTVIVQQVPIAIAPQVVDVNGVFGVAHILTGSGRAQVFVGGHEYDASWRQPSAGPPAFTLADGTPAPMAPGLVWVELVATGSTAHIS